MFRYVGDSIIPIALEDILAYVWQLAGYRRSFRTDRNILVGVTENMSRREVVVDIIN